MLMWMLKDVDVYVYRYVDVSVAGAFLDILGPGGTVPFGAPLMGGRRAKRAKAAGGFGGGGGRCNPP